MPASGQTLPLLTDANPSKIHLSIDVACRRPYRDGSAGRLAVDIPFSDSTNGRKYDSEADA
jgi:hypothetical protein